MKERSVMIFYRSVLPVAFLVAFPGWFLKMLRRGGLGTALHERIGIYLQEKEYEPCGAIHLHAVSVGETLLALKLIRAWLAEEPASRFVLATGTATGHATASASDIPGLRVTYCPLDFPWMIRSYLSRFEPSSIILIEGEVWPGLLIEAERRGTPVSLANARTSPRSAARFRKFASLLRPFFSRLTAVCIQEEGHRTLWEDLGIAPQDIHLTGSLKFDPLGAQPPPRDPAFAEMLAGFGTRRRIVLAASTFPGEEIMLAEAIHTADPDALPVIVPRHAERSAEVSADLARAGFSVSLRSSPRAVSLSSPHAFVIDSTGELATWMTHADVVVMGKSFLSTGGQNPAEAIIARKPVILGSHMGNFQPLVRHLIEADAVLTAHDSASVANAILRALDPRIAASLTSNATAVLARHEGATARHLRILRHSHG